MVIETYNFNITDNNLRFADMCGLLETKGFGVIDMCEPIARELDGAFWQMDLFFVPADRQEFHNNAFK